MIIAVGEKDVPGAIDTNVALLFEPGRIAFILQIGQRELRARRGAVVAAKSALGAGDRRDHTGLRVKANGRM